VGGISPVSLLLAHIASTDLGRISNPDFVAQSLQQLDQPLAVATSFHANQRWSRQPPVKAFRLPISVDQLVLSNLSGFAVENRNLLPRRMEITPNSHEGFS